MNVILNLTAIGIIQRFIEVCNEISLTAREKNLKYRDVFKSLSFSLSVMIMEKMHYKLMCFYMYYM